MIKAIILDMDGIIIDSEPLHSKAFREILKEYGHEAELDENGMAHKSGMLTEDNWESLKTKHNINEDISVLAAKKREHYREILMQEIEPMPGLLELIQIAKEYDLKLAVASNSKKEVIELILERLNIKHEFDFIVGRDFLENSKPHPEIYITVARELGIDPLNCVGIEDSSIGVEAAARAGMKVIAVPISRNNDLDISKADMVVDSLEDINWDILSKI